MQYGISILLSGISLGGQYALIAIGYTMVYGILRLINFAHCDIFMMSMYFCYYFICNKFSFILKGEIVCSCTNSFAMKNLIVIIR